MTQVGRGLKGAIISCVIVFCDFDRVFCASKYLQMIRAFVIAMRNDNAAVACFSNQNLAEIEWSSQQSFETSLDGRLHR
jgi:hypothetical protein